MMPIYSVYNLIYTITGRQNALNSRYTCKNHNSRTQNITNF